jgi:hypothetical protein
MEEGGENGASCSSTQLGGMLAILVTSARGRWRKVVFRRANAVQSLSVALHFRDAAYTINRRAACTPRVGLQDRGSTACCGDTPALSSSSSFSRLYGEGLELS